MVTILAINFLPQIFCTPICLVVKCIYLCISTDFNFANFFHGSNRTADQYLSYTTLASYSNKQQERPSLFQRTESVVEKQKQIKK
jgi:hypothetical protein